MIKKLDRFILNSYLWTFLATFCVCSFILIMQMLWRHMDKLAGKGLSLDVFGEFFFWVFVTAVPMALPLAVLTAAIISFGNLGEHFELTAIKSGGVSLMRIMMPLTIVSVMTVGASFYFQNNVATKAQIKMWTLLLSIKQTSPEVDIPEGVFYDQIPGYNLFVDHKDKKTGMLRDVMIYNFADGFADARIIKADSARLSTTADKKYLWLNMYNGEQFENLKMQSNNMLREKPYRREIFTRKKFLIEFNTSFEKMDEGFMTKQYMSQNLTQLQQSIDSLQQDIDSMGKFLYTRMNTTVFAPVVLSSQDSVQYIAANKSYSKRAVANIVDSAYSARSAASRRATIQQVVASTTGMDWELQGATAIDTNKLLWLYEIEWHKKFALSLACLIFFFIGAPLGSIIRKGGIGTPMVVSVLFFVIYFIIDEMGKKMAMEGIWSVWAGMWLSTFVLLPVACFLTYMANKDSTVFNAELYLAFLRRLVGIRERRNLTHKEVIIDEPDMQLADTLLTEIKQQSIEYMQSASPQLVADISEKLEQLCEQLSNSRSEQIIILLNQLPILSPRAHLWIFRWRLKRDLTQIISLTDQLVVTLQPICLHQ